MNRSRSLWLLAVFVLVLLMAGFGAWPQAGWTQTVPPPTETPGPDLPAVHPIYGDCDPDGNGTVPPPVFEPFLPDSIYVDWCGRALLTIAAPGVAASSLHGDDPIFDPAVGHRIGFFYTTDETETGWFIANYSYRVDFDDRDDLRERQEALLREICPLGNICNVLLVAKVGKEGAEFSVVDVAGERQVDPLNNRLFVPYVSNED